MSEFDVETFHTPAFWDERYAGHEAVWSGRANQRLVEQTSHLDPGTPLDIGCGEGGDAVWLAQQGWTVLAIDVSSIVIDKARTLAEATLGPEVAGRITWRQADIRSWQPPADSFDSSRCSTSTCHTTCSPTSRRGSRPRASRVARS